MSFLDCLNRTIQAGEIDPTRAREAKDLFEEIVEDTARFNENSAAQEVFDILQFKAFEKKRRRAIKIRLAAARIQEQKSYVNAYGQNDQGSGFRALHSRDQFARYDSMEERHLELESRAHGMIAGILATFRRTLTGQTRNKASLTDMVDELFGTDTKNLAAKEMADSWTEMSEWQRVNANRAGMAIPKRQDWGMPQTHDVLKTRGVTRGVWVADHRDLIDPQKLIDYVSGFKPNKLGVDEILGEMYDTITTKGLGDLDPNLSRGGKSLAARRAEHRYLPFKDSASWRAHHEKYGEGDAFSVMMSHVDSMSRDIAQLEIFGPDPEAMRAFLKQSAEKSATAKAIANEKRKSLGFTFRGWETFTRDIINQSDNMMETFTGRVNSTAGGEVARTFAGFRSGHSAAVLGGAAVTALTDLAFGRLAARFAGLPQTKLLSNMMKNLLALDQVERGTVAIRLGLGAQHWSTVGSSQMRYIGEVEGPEVMRRISDGVLRVSGLTPWTTANRWGFGMTFLGDLADHAGTKFDGLHPKMQKLMTRYGIDEADWEVIRSTPLYNAAVDVDGWVSGPGTRFIRPENIARRTDLSPALTDQVTNKLLRMVQSETAFAVPFVSLKSRVQIIGRTQPGTIPGELLRSTAMYKSFFLEVMNTHLVRIMAQSGAMAKGAMAAELVLTATLLGGFVLQLKSIMLGKDPQEMSVDFWASAFLQGGSSGPIGDLLFKDIGEFGGFGGTARQIAGPLAEVGDDIFRKIFAENLIEAGRGDETHFGREMIRLLRRYTPGGTIWYSRLAYERILLDQMQLWADPNAQRSLNARQRRLRTQTGQRYWWKPGKAPERAPQF